MIDSSLFTVERLLGAMFDDMAGNVDRWRRYAEIIPKYMPPYPSKDTRPSCVVRWHKSYLRYSKGPVQGYSWDMYGDDMLSPELALLALLRAPIPPCAMTREAFTGEMMNGNEKLR